jgi:hypothetical protein
MKKQHRLQAIVALITLTAGHAKAVTIQTNDHKTIIAIGSLPINGALYDVSFDQSFGSTMFRGDASFFQAGYAITTLQNQLELHPYFPTRFPSFYGGVNIVFGIVDDGEPDFNLFTRVYQSDYGAGFTSYVFDFPGVQEFYEPFFRIAIPNSIPNTIPEPTSSLLFALGMIGTLVHRRRNRRGEQVETQQPPLAALSATSPIL